VSDGPGKEKVMSDRRFGAIFGIGAAIFIIAVTYFGSLLPVPENWVAGQAMPGNE
jgi:hypothetical protein